MRSTWKWLTPVAVLVLACGWPGLASAATIDYYASGFFSQSQIQVENSSGQKNDSGQVTDQNTNNVSTYPSEVVTDVSAQSDNYGQHDSYDDNHRYVGVSSSVSGYSSDAGGIMTGYGEIHTLTPANTNGIFFIINPSAGEHVGDPVTLFWDWGGQMQTGAGTTAALTGGFLADMAITLNDYPVPGNPDPGKTIWSYTGQSLGPDDYFSDNVSGDHLAHIGDIIGVHLGAMASVDFTGDTSGVDVSAYSDQQIDFYVDTLPIPVPGAIWLLGGGLLGLAGLRRKLKS